MSEKNVQPKPKSEQEKMQEFYKEYTALCEKHGFTIAVVPTFKPTNHGSWEVVLQQSIGRISKQEVVK